MTQHGLEHAPARSGAVRSVGRTHNTRAARNAPHPIGRLLGLPDAGDAAVAEALAAARAREEAARAKLAEAREAKARETLRQQPVRRNAPKRAIVLPLAAPAHERPGPEPRCLRPFSPQESQVLRLMAERSWPSVHALTDAVIGEPSTKRQRNCVAAVICNVRHKLEKRGVTLPARLSHGRVARVAQIELPGHVRAEIDL